MSKAEEFRQYAEEAVRWACKSKTEQEKQAFMDLARTWAQAAVRSERIVVVSGSTLEPRAP
jgi:hypothetical protein